MILTEKTHISLYRPYFRGQQKNHKSFKDVIFYTRNLIYALHCAHKDGTVLEYKLKDNVNIFNIKDNADFNKLHKYINDNHVNISYNILEDLKEDDWLSVLKDNKKQWLLDIIQNLGYNGFFCFKLNETMKKELIGSKSIIVHYPMPATKLNPAIGVFVKVDPFIYKNSYSLDDLKKSTFKDFIYFNQKEKDFIEDQFYFSEAQFDTDSAYYSCFQLINSTLTLEQNDVIEVIKNNFLYHRPIVSESF